jgi:hypothetical protein
VTPAVGGADPAEARRAIRNSFFSQAQKSKKGKVFLRAEVLYNMQATVREGRCFQLSDGYLLVMLNTADQGEHYLFGRYPSRPEQVSFALCCLGNFFLAGSDIKAARQVVKTYMDQMASDIHVTNAIRKTLIALPLIVGLASMISLLYYFTIGGITGSLLVGGGILFIGTGIAAKNGYDEDFTPASHEKIPDYLHRQQGKIVPTSINVETFSHSEQKSLRGENGL